MDGDDADEFLRGLGIDTASDAAAPASAAPEPPAAPAASAPVGEAMSLAERRAFAKRLLPAAAAHVAFIAASLRSEEAFMQGVGHFNGDHPQRVCRLKWGAKDEPQRSSVYWPPAEAGKGPLGAHVSATVCVDAGYAEGRARLRAALAFLEAAGLEGELAAAERARATMIFSINAFDIPIALIG